MDFIEKTRSRLKRIKIPRAEMQAKIRSQSTPTVYRMPKLPPHLTTQKNPSKPDKQRPKRAKTSDNATITIPINYYAINHYSLYPVPADSSHHSRAGQREEETHSTHSALHSEGRGINPLKSILHKNIRKLLPLPTAAELPEVGQYSTPTGNEDASKTRLFMRKQRGGDFEEESDCFKSLKRDCAVFFDRVRSSRREVGPFVKSISTLDNVVLVEDVEEELGCLENCCKNLEDILHESRELCSLLQGAKYKDSASISTETDPESIKIISQANVNTPNLWKELGKQMLMKTRRSKEQVHGNGDNLETLMSGFEGDIQTKKMFSATITAGQEQLVLEEVFGLLRSQGFDLDSCFRKAYTKLNVEGGTTQVETEDEILEDTPLSETSFEETPFQADLYKEQPAVEFPLDFNALQFSESEEEDLHNQDQD